MLLSCCIRSLLASVLNIDRLFGASVRLHLDIERPKFIDAETETEDRKKRDFGLVRCGSVWFGFRCKCAQANMLV